MCRVTRFWSIPKEDLAPAAGVTRHNRLGVLGGLTRYFYGWQLLIPSYPLHSIRFQAVD